MRRNVSESTVINCMGLRAEESPNRAKAQVFRQLKISNSKRTVYEWLPIHAMTTDEVLAYSQQYGIPLHPVYIWAGGYLKRFSCRLCIMMTAGEIRLVYDHDREAFDSIANLESE